MDKVLVTGGSGFAGGWCVRALLDKGYQVNATVRDARRGQDLAGMLQLPSSLGERLKVSPADLDSHVGWSEAVEGCRYVLHIASPPALSFPDEPERQLEVGRRGVQRLVGAALDAGVERVVVTSTTFTMAYPKGGEGRLERSEGDWTDPEDSAVPPYIRMKTLRERNAWQLADGRDARITTGTTSLRPKTERGGLVADRQNVRRAEFAAQRI